MTYGPILGPALQLFADPVHASAFFTLGLLAGQQQPRRGAAALAGFGIALLLLIRASFYTSALKGFAPFEAMASAALLLACGTLVALELRLPIWLAAFAGTLLGGVHGLALGLGFASSKTAFAVVGAAGAAIVLAAVGAGLAYVMNGPRGRAVVRVLGSWSAALGLILLGLALRG